jgi:hypothetical protein
MIYAIHVNTLHGLKVEITKEVEVFLVNKTNILKKLIDSALDYNVINSK